MYTFFCKSNISCTSPYSMLEKKTEHYYCCPWFDNFRIFPWGKAHIYVMWSPNMAHCSPPFPSLFQHYLWWECPTFRVGLTDEWHPVPCIFLGTFMSRNFVAVLIFCSHFNHLKCKKLRTGACSPYLRLGFRLTCRELPI